LIGPACFEGRCAVFDPYHKWLGIPRNQRPPTHYQLLGISPDETDPDVIKESALRQTSHVRIYQTGAHGAECTQVLNEIAQARAVVLNPTARTQYDAQLALAAKDPGASHPAATQPDLPALEKVGPQTQVSEGRLSQRLTRKSFSGTAFSAIGYAVLLLVGAAAAFWVTSQGLNHAPPIQRENDASPNKFNQKATGKTAVGERGARP
jgi:hypothetical protein